MLLNAMFVYLTPQSGDAQPGTVLALTIIPVHDDNIDLEYEPVSYTWCTCTAF